MDFDLKSLFQDPPRIKDEVRRYIHALAEQIVERACEHFRLLSVDRILPRHVRLVVFQMCPDPCVAYTREGFCAQQMRVKTLGRVLSRTMSDVESSGDTKRAGIDRKIIKGTAKILDARGIKHSTAGTLALSACVAEVCGIVLNLTATLMETRTMSLDCIRRYGTTHILSSREKCVNKSLQRFLYAVEQPIPSPPRAVPPEEKQKKPAETDRGPPPRRYRYENKKVTFDESSGAARPSTPDNCFWEED